MATSPKEPSTGAPSLTSPQPMLPALDKGISSLASEVGRTLFDSLESPTMPTSGPAPAPVNRSRTRARGAEFSTLDIFGQHGSHSSESVALQSSLESRLRAAMASSGSTLFSLTWNDAVTPSGRRICALRASALRMSVNVCTSWPTPTTASGDHYGRGNLKLPGAARAAAWPTPTVSRGDYSYANGDHETPTLKLPGAAKTAAWPTPLANSAAGGGSERHMDGRRSNLRDTVMTASWATPAAHEAGGTPASFMARKERAAARGVSIGVSLTSLAMQVQLADSGAQPTGSFAEIQPEAPPVARPVEPGTWPLAHGVPGRVGLLRGYGNAIVPQVAAQFIKAAPQAIGIS